MDVYYKDNYSLIVKHFQELCQILASCVIPGQQLSKDMRKLKVSTWLLPDTNQGFSEFTSVNKLSDVFLSNINPAEWVELQKCAFHPNPEIKIKQTTEPHIKRSYE